MDWNPFRDEPPKKTEKGDIGTRAALPGRRGARAAGKDVSEAQFVDMGTVAAERLRAVARLNQRRQERTTLTGVDIKSAHALAEEALEDCDDARIPPQKKMTLRAEDSVQLVREDSVQLVRENRWLQMEVDELRWTVTTKSEALRVVEERCTALEGTLSAERDVRQAIDSSQAADLSAEREQAAVFHMAKILSLHQVIEEMERDLEEAEVEVEVTREALKEWSRVTAEQSEELELSHRRGEKEGAHFGYHLAATVLMRRYFGRALAQKLGRSIRLWLRNVKEDLPRQRSCALQTEAQLRRVASVAEINRRRQERTLTGVKTTLAELHRLKLIMVAGTWIGKLAGSLTRAKMLRALNSMKLGLMVAMEEENVSLVRDMRAVLRHHAALRLKWTVTGSILSRTMLKPIRCWRAKLANSREVDRDLERWNEEARRQQGALDAEVTRLEHEELRRSEHIQAELQELMTANENLVATTETSAEVYQQVKDQLTVLEGKLDQSLQAASRAADFGLRQLQRQILRGSCGSRLQVMKLNYNQERHHNNSKNSLNAAGLGAIRLDLQNQIECVNKCLIIWQSRTKLAWMDRHCRNLYQSKSVVTNQLRVSGIKWLLVTISKHSRLKMIIKEWRCSSCHHWLSKLITKLAGEEQDALRAAKDLLGRATVPQCA